MRKWSQNAKSFTKKREENQVLERVWGGLDEEEE